MRGYVQFNKYTHTHNDKTLLTNARVPRIIPSALETCTPSPQGLPPSPPFNSLPVCAHSHPSCALNARAHAFQISRLALRGDCLFSAGHDGNVNQYVITYPRPGRRRGASAAIQETRGVFGGISGGISGSGRESAAAGDTEAFSSTGLPVGDDAPPEKHQLRQEQRQPPVVLTLVTCHAAAPITAISDLWVGGGRGVEVGEVGSTGQGGAPGLRLAVAGRSGRSTMSLWDLTEGRQLLEVRERPSDRWG